MTPARKLYLDNIRWMTVVLVVIYHVVYPQQCIHLLRRILIAAVLVMYQNVIHFLDLPGCLLAEATYRSSQRKDPNGGTDRHMVVPHQINAHRFNGHCPAVHPIASAPPEAQCSFCALRGANFIESSTCSIGFFHRLLFLHSPSVKNKLPAVWGSFRYGDNRFCVIDTKRITFVTS